MFFLLLIQFDVNIDQKSFAFVWLILLETVIITHEKKHTYIYM